MPSSFLAVDTAGMLLFSQEGHAPNYRIWGAQPVVSQTATPAKGIAIPTATVLVDCAASNAILLPRWCQGALLAGRET